MIVYMKTNIFIPLKIEVKQFKKFKSILSLPKM